MVWVVGMHVHVSESEGAEGGAEHRSVRAGCVHAAAVY